MNKAEARELLFLFDAVRKRRRASRATRQLLQSSVTRLFASIAKALGYEVSLHDVKTAESLFIMLDSISAEPQVSVRAPEGMKVIQEGSIATVELTPEAQSDLNYLKRYASNWIDEYCCEGERERRIMLLFGPFDPDFDEK